MKSLTKKTQKNENKIKENQRDENKEMEYLEWRLGSVEALRETEEWHEWWTTGLAMATAEEERKKKWRC